MRFKDVMPKITFKKKEVHPKSSGEGVRGEGSKIDLPKTPQDLFGDIGTESTAKVFERTIGRLGEQAAHARTQKNAASTQDTIRHWDQEKVQLKAAQKMVEELQKLLVKNRDYIQNLQKIINEYNNAERYPVSDKIIKALEEQKQVIEQERIYGDPIAEIKTLHKVMEGTFGPWRPQLSSEAREALKELSKLHNDVKRGRDVSADEHTAAIDKVLRELSPETLQDFQAYNVKRVSVNDPDSPWYPVIENRDGQLEARFNMSYPYPIRGLVYRTCDLPLQFKNGEDGIPDPETRAEVEARVYHMNARLGGYGYGLAGHEPARIFNANYIKGISKAIKHGEIDENASSEELTAKGYAYAREKLLESIRPMQDDQGNLYEVFPNNAPGASFEEKWFWDLHGGQRSVRVGSEEFKDFMEKLVRRAEKGKDVSIVGNMLSNKEIWLQLNKVSFSRDINGQHIMNTGAMPCPWSGMLTIKKLEEGKAEIGKGKEKEQLEESEAEIGKGYKISKASRKSGHYRTRGNATNFVLRRFQQMGFDISEVEIEEIEDFQKANRPRTDF